MSEKTIACNLTLEEINSLAETLEKNKLERIKIKNGESEIVIEAKRHHHHRHMPPPFMGQIPPAMPSGVQNAPVQPETPAETQKAESSGNIVKSPIVGTFYAAPSPDKPPFVKTGDTVKKGDVIMIIESMKLMNEIQSDYSGTVDRILVSDGQAVEFDQPIMIIK